MRHWTSFRPIPRLAAQIRRLCRDDDGAEILEYVLIAGLIIVGAIALIGAVGVKVMARWTSVSNASL
jgi:Flp pilus assembly pilin Flp